MNGRMIPFAVAACLAAGTPVPLEAPAPTPDAVDWLADRSPRPPPVFRPALMVGYAEFQCLALNVYWEARGEPEEGQMAVAHVTLNRVGAEGFPNTICDVVHQGSPTGPCQFEWWCDGKPDEPTHAAAWRRAQSAALRALAGGPDPTGGALFFHNVRERPQFASGRYAGKVRIGEHVFFRLADAAPRLAMARE